MVKERLEALAKEMVFYEALAKEMAQGAENGQQFVFLKLCISYLNLST